MAKSKCYCGQKGNSSFCMLECLMCKKWYHESCIKCLSHPILLGDRFYLYICKNCNAGAECLGRIELKWPEIAHLLLYNLTCAKKTTYFDLDQILVPFLFENWDRFCIYGRAASQKKDICFKLLQLLPKFQRKFKCGLEAKKGKNTWALRVKTSPRPPPLLSFSSHEDNAVVTWNFKVKGRKCHIISDRKCKNKTKSVNRRSRIKNSTSQLRPGVSSGKKHLYGRKNGIRKRKEEPKVKKPRKKRATKAKVGLLDSLIPWPPNFDGANNPFASFVKKQSSKPSQKRVPSKREKQPKMQSSASQTDSDLSETDAGAGRLPRACKTAAIRNLKPKPDAVVGKRTLVDGRVEYLIERTINK